MEFLEWLFMEWFGQLLLWILFAGGAIVIKKLKPYQATVSEYFPTFIKATLFAIFIIVAFNVLHKLNETLDATASKESTRPYFSQVDAAIQSISKESHFLLIGLKSNDRTAENVVKQILLIEESLDPTIEPLLTERKELAGPIGPNSEFNLSVPFEIRKQNGTKLLFIVIQYLSKSFYSAQN